MSETEGTTPTQHALQRVVDQIEMGAAAVGWDRPPSLYALVPTAQLLQAPGLPDDVAESLRADWDGSPHHLSAVAQDAIAEDALEELLPRLEWPDTVAGAALTVERIVLPQDAQDASPEDPEEALAYAQEHPARTDIRVVVGVNRKGESWCEVRSRRFDARENVGKGSNLAPGVVQSLQLGFAESQTGDSPQQP